MYGYDPESPQYKEAYRKAAKQVEAKVGFYWHLSAYLVVHGFLITIFLLTGPLPGFYYYPWFVWSMAGWGIGLMFHYLGVFVYGKQNNNNLRRQMIEEEMRRMGVVPPTDQPPKPPVP
jgi:2TM domain